MVSDQIQRGADDAAEEVGHFDRQLCHEVGECPSAHERSSDGTYY